MKTQMRSFVRFVPSQLAGNVFLSNAEALYHVRQDVSSCFFADGFVLSLRPAGAGLLLAGDTINIASLRDRTARRGRLTWALRHWALVIRASTRLFSLFLRHP